MRCHKAKRLLNEGRLTDRDLAGHIKDCPDCAREAKAAGLITESLGSLRGQSPAPTPFSEMRHRLETHPAATNEKESLRMAELTHKMGARKKLGFGLGLAVAALLFFTLAPFSYDRVVGYDVEIGGIEPGQTVNINPIVKGLAGLGYDQVSVSTNYSSTETTVSITNLPHKKAAQEASAVFATMTGLTGEVEFEPRVEAVSGSLYAQVKENLFQVEITATGDTPEEIKASVESQLESMGIIGGEAVVTEDGDQMQIEITIPSDQ
jgi:hypothetical protein